MLKLTNIKTPADSNISPAALAARTLGIQEKEIKDVRILKLSFDSRKKPKVFRIYTLAVSIDNEERFICEKRPDILPYSQKCYSFPQGNFSFNLPPVIVGAGPAGLFAALTLSESGKKCILIERGRPVERRIMDVRRFWETGCLDESSNVQFGEGGAGTFSDGKLNTGVNDMRIPYIFKRFVEFGAPAEITYLSKPHIGTDYLYKVIRNMRNHLTELGCDIRFETKLENLIIENGRISGIVVSSPGSRYIIETKNVILAPGNSARDTFRMLHSNGIPMSPKSFAVGVRIEHLQKDIDLSQYGEAATLGTLPASSYKLAVHLPSGRSVFTFCVCPGGQVVAASSERGSVVTNGMSEHARGNENINGGLLVGVSPEDFRGTLFGGMEFQERLEKAAYAYGGGYLAPAQLVGDFLENRTSVCAGRVKPSYIPGVCFGNLRDVLPSFITDALSEALPLMDRKIHGFAAADAVLTAVETRSSSPVRIERGTDMQSIIKGLFPCGEGAGFAGGITSSAVDGIKCAEAVCASVLK